MKEKEKTVIYFLNQVFESSFPIEERKREMKRIGKVLCNSRFHVWSDIYGENLKPIDDISYKELLSIIKSI